MDKLGEALQRLIFAFSDDSSNGAQGGWRSGEPGSRLAAGDERRGPLGDFRDRQLESEAPSDPASPSLRFGSQKQFRKSLPIQWDHL
jgi:hypothetical protein